MPVPHHAWRASGCGGWERKPRILLPPSVREGGTQVCFLAFRSSCGALDLWFEWCSGGA